MESVWKKPVVVFYKERMPREKTAFAVVKAKSLTVSKVPNLSGNLKDFFPLMGDIEQISSGEGSADQYVLCWFDDEKNDFSQAWLRLVGVRFPKGISLTMNEAGKKTYNASFSAESGKLE